ncbi:hypothetical protein EOK76_g0916 [Lacticaseibacillus paracasei]|nr:hypothetical protein EOK76_g0916 [Lacticaseibacillus paracasei]
MKNLPKNIAAIGNKMKKSVLKRDALNSSFPNDILSSQECIVLFFSTVAL